MEDIKEINEKINELEERKKEVKKSKKVKANKIIRVDINFDKKLVRVQDKRIEYGIDEIGKEISKPKLTSLIIKHINWRVIEDDLINYRMEDKNEQ